MKASFSRFLIWVKIMDFNLIGTLISPMTDSTNHHPNRNKAMKKKFFYFFALILISFVSEADDKKYSICSVAGFFEGNSNRFLSDLAVRTAVKNNLMTDEGCKLAIKDGKEIGERYSKPGRVKKPSDQDVIFHATHFSNLIYDSILSKVSFLN